MIKTYDVYKIYLLKPSQFHHLPFHLILQQNQDLQIPVKIKWQVYRIEIIIKYNWFNTDKIEKYISISPPYRVQVNAAYEFRRYRVDCHLAP